MKTWQELETNDNFQAIYPYTEEQLEAMENIAVANGEILHPLISWNGTLIFGYPYHRILQKHPDLKYTIKEKVFENWQDAKAWTVEYYVSMPEITLPHKLLMAIQCEEYWYYKEQAKKTQGKRNDLSSQSEEKLKSKTVDAIIARKVGCSETYVYYFRRIGSSGRKDIIDACLGGEMSISAAYKKLFPSPKTTTPGKKNSVNSDTSIQLDLESTDIVTECERNKDVGNKVTDKSNGIPVNPLPVAEKINLAKVPNGAIWIVLYPKERQLQIFKRTLDETVGQVHIKVNSYNCRLVERDLERIVYEADHINVSTEDCTFRNEQAFETTVVDPHVG